MQRAPHAHRTTAYNDTHPRFRLGVSHHQNDLLRKRSRDGSSVQAYAYGVPGNCLRRADASFTPIHEV